MKILLRMPEDVFGDLMRHLLPAGSRREEAAFVFASTTRGEETISFDVLAAEKLGHEDFDSQMDDYLELGDAARARLIKRAHDLGASLIEMHSHPGPWPAAFSFADRMGLTETVPHMWWRLPKRPYVAIVVAKSGFDALVWLDNPKIPQALDGLLAGNRLLRPTNNSLKGW
jgi:proteasome lid subunit RPN8/RPN11